MLNLSKRSLTDTQARFIDEMASLLTPRGMPQTAARLYAYLLLSEEPVGLDQIAADLQISKSGACTGAKLLEQQAIARRHGERGSKRVLYSATDTYGGPMTDQTVLLGALEALIASTVKALPPGPAVQRLAGQARFYGQMRRAMEAVLQTINGVPPGPGQPRRAQGRPDPIGRRLKAG